MSKDKRKVIIDTDPGIDDAVALLYALKNPNLEVVGITTTGGNKGLEDTTVNATKILKFLGRKDVLVYKGEEKTYTDYATNRNTVIDFENFTTHGDDGLGSVDLEADLSLISDESATDFILRIVKENPKQIDIVAIGPLTNIAYCVEKDIETMKQVREIHSMGGGVFKGNMTPVAEFNYWFDAYAVNKVYEIGTEVPIYMIGLDVTHQTLIDMNDLTYMKYEGGETGNLIFDMTKDYLDAYWETNKYVGAVIHDLVTMVGLTNPEIYTKVINANLRCVTDNEVAYGQCLVDLVDSWKLPKNSFVPMGIDTDLYKNLVMETILK